MKSDKIFNTTVAIGTVFAGLTTILIQSTILAPTQAIKTVALIEVFLSTFNIIILSALTTNYVKMYREINTPITRSLMLFSCALLLYSVSSSPVIHMLLGLELITIGPFTYLPDLFVASASLTLLYENYR